jgi:hypothetical protein
MDAADIERHVDATAVLLGLPLAVDDEPAEVFVPVGPPR